LSVPELSISTLMLSVPYRGHNKGLKVIYLCSVKLLLTFCVFFPQVDPNEIYLRLEQVADDTPTNAKVTLVSDTWYSCPFLFRCSADLFIPEPLVESQE